MSVGRLVFTWPTLATIKLWFGLVFSILPTADAEEILDRSVTDECYRRIINGLLENPQAKITLNINSILCELWDEHGHHDVLSGLKP